MDINIIIQEFEKAANKFISNLFYRINMLGESHTHNLDYILKTDEDGSYCARVLQIPAVMVQTDKKEEIEDKLQKATIEYFEVFNDEHDRIKNSEESIYRDSGNGIIIETKEFKVSC